MDKIYGFRLVIATVSRTGVYEFTASFFVASNNKQYRMEGTHPRLSGVFDAVQGYIDKTVSEA